MRILWSRLSPPPWFELLDDEENEDEVEDDMSEDVTSSGSWWQVWEGVGSMIQCNEQWVQLCGGSAICMSSCLCLSLWCHSVAVLLCHYQSRFGFYKTSFSSYSQSTLLHKWQRVESFLLILVTLRPSSSNNNCRSGPGCHPPPSPPPNTPRCRKIEEAT